jgi:hypothetical protein
MVPHVLCAIAEATVPDGWHTIVAALVEFISIFLQSSFSRGLNLNYRLFVPQLQPPPQLHPPPQQQ